MPISLNISIFSSYKINILLKSAYYHSIKDFAVCQNLVSIELQAREKVKNCIWQSYLLTSLSNFWCHLMYLFIYLSVYCIFVFFVFIFVYLYIFCHVSPPAQKPCPFHFCLWSYDKFLKKGFKQKSESWKKVICTLSYVYAGWCLKSCQRGQKSVNLKSSFPLHRPPSPELRFKKGKLLLAPVLTKKQGFWCD